MALAGTGCGTAKSATAVPDGAAVSKYVGAKFEAIFDKLRNSSIPSEGVKSQYTTYFSVDERKSDFTLTAVQVGSPRARLTRLRNNRDPDIAIDTYEPAKGSIAYKRLGKFYESLARTPWVSLPKQGKDLTECFWLGYEDVCSLMNVFGAAYQGKGGSRATTAKQLEEGMVELRAEVTLQLLMDKRVVNFPPDLIAKISPKMKTAPLKARMVIDGDQATLIEINGELSDAGHTVAVKVKYDAAEKPTEADLPAIPKKSEVTALKTEKQVEDFYGRMDKLHKK